MQSPATDSITLTTTSRVGSCYLEVSFGTTGVATWGRGYLVCPGVLPGVTWALPGVTCFCCMVPKYPRSRISNFWEKINFHLEILPGPTLVVVTWLPGSPSCCSTICTTSYFSQLSQVTSRDLTFVPRAPRGIGARRIFATKSRLTYKVQGRIKTLVIRID